MALEGKNKVLRISAWWLVLVVVVYGPCSSLSPGPHHAHLLHDVFDPVCSCWLSILG